MILKITATTDNKFLGFEFTDSYPITLPNGAAFSPDSVVKIDSKNFKLITSNYVIDAKKGSK